MNLLFAEFDGELMFHSNDTMSIIAKFKNYNSVYDVVKSIVSDKEFVRKKFFYDDLSQNDPAKFNFNSGIINYHDHIKEIKNKLLHYYKNPQALLNDFKSEWKNSSSFVIVCRDEVMCDLLKIRDIIQADNDIQIFSN